MTIYVSVDLHEKIHDAIRKYLFNPPYKGMFGTADDLTEVVIRTINEHMQSLEEDEDADPELHDVSPGDENREPGPDYPRDSRR